MQCKTCEGPKSVIGVRPWVQQACNLKDSPVVLACDGGDYPELGISNINNQRATFTTTYKTSCRDNCKRVPAKRTLGDPPDKTLDLVVAADCGGFDIDQLASGKVNIYLEFVCCCGKAATSFDQVDSYAVITGVDFSVGYSIPNLTNIDGTEVDVQYSFSGVPFDDMYHNSATTANVVVSGSGTLILSSTFLEPVTDCNDKAQCDGAQKWATIDNVGTLTIGTGSGIPQTYTVPGLTAGNNAYIEQIGDKLYIIYTGASGDAYACVSLGTNCVPQGNWANNSLTADLGFIRGACADDNGNLIVYGQSPNFANGVIVSVAPNGTVETLLDTPAGPIFDVAKCGKNMIAVGDNGAVFKSTGCAGVFEQLITPNGAVDVVGAEIFGPNCLYVIDRVGFVWCTVDCAQTPWQQIPAAQQGNSFTNDVEFYDELFGVTHGPSGISVTTNGGYTWSDSFMDLPAGFTVSDVKFDCDRPGCALISGRLNGAGAAVLMKPENCA